MPQAKRLNRFQRRFAQKVALGMRASQAVVECGWKGTQPRTKAARLMALPHVREYVKKLEDDALATAGITRAQIAQELGRIAFADPRKILNGEGGMKPLNEIDNDTAAAIAGLDVEELFEGRGEDREQIGVVRKVKLWNKREALSELAAIAGMKRSEQQNAQPVGPGLTVIVQQGVNVQGQQNVQTHRVEVQLPRPEQT